MKINRNNYELYFVDFLEGNLDEKLVDEFIEFLQQNPDLKKELSLFESIAFYPENIAFSKKDKLYKEVYYSKTNFNKTAIAKFEGDLSEKEKADFENYLKKYPEKQKEVELFSKTKLIPDRTITFNKKNILYHKSTGKTIFLWSVRMAAILIVAIVIYILSDSAGNQNFDENKLTQVKKEIPMIETTPTIKQNEQIQIINKEKKDTTSVIKSETNKPEIKIPESKTKPAKSLRETNKGRIENDDLALQRIPVEIPITLTNITASLNTNAANNTLEKITFHEIEEPIEKEKYLVEIVKEKTGFNKLSINKIKQSSLNLISNITKDNLSYETNKKGKITEINYDSRLLAFSIPTNKE